VLFAGPVKPNVLGKWAQLAPAGALGLVAPFPLTHRKPPSAARLWEHDASSGDFRTGDPARSALSAFAEALGTVRAGCAVFRSPATFSPSAANRDLLRAFFGELATAEAVGAERVWVPGGLWDARAAVKLATELGVTCAIDPLVREPGEPPEVHYDLEASALYLRVEGVGRAGPIRTEKLEDLAALVEHYEDLSLTIAFASPERWHDAKNLRKLLGER
jgi:uncharacterized protein YecE (DUF72 family)